MVNGAHVVKEFTFCIFYNRAYNEKLQGKMRCSRQNMRIKTCRVVKVDHRVIHDSVCETVLNGMYQNK